MKENEGESEAKKKKGEFTLELRSKTKLI